MKREVILPRILDQLNVGVFVVDQEMRISYWNQFMAVHSGCSSESVLGHRLFELFPEVPERWFRRKCLVALSLHQRAFSSWEQRPFLLRFKNIRPVTVDLDEMRQDCVFMPVENEDGVIDSVCVMVADVTDVYVARTHLKNALVELEEVSIRDGLTGIYNRRQISHLLSVEFNRHKRYGSPLAIAMVDLDHFKAVNDRYGHPAGDEVLRSVARCIAQRIRVTDSLGRYGGEEFLVLFPGIDADQVVWAAEALRERVERLSIAVGDERVRPTVSIGTCGAISAHDAEIALLQAADAALYEAKNRGRNRVVSCGPGACVARGARA